MNYIVITSIHGLTECIKEFAKKEGWHIVIVGDKKSKPIKSTDNLTYLSVGNQIDLGYHIVDALPYNHYCRKNIGYLYAMNNGAEVIYETDDDNSPYDDNWGVCRQMIKKIELSGSRFVNIFHQYTAQRPVWPRGFPLDEVLNEDAELNLNLKDKEVNVPVWGGITAGDPDLDSIYRLTNNKPIEFQTYGQMYLARECYCPFNSQDTFWFKEAFKLMLLPTTVEFRFTDILRGYIAQPILWAAGCRLGFTGVNTYQKRNEHNLMNDFRDEMRMFDKIKDIVECIENAVSDKMLIHSNLISVYKALYNEGVIKGEDIDILHAWLEDLYEAKKNV
jgi:hypothetical protein